MNSLKNEKQLASSMINEAISIAIAAIAPAWPLDRMIAVNPYWGHIDRSFELCDQLHNSLAGSSLCMPLDYYRQAWEAERILPAHLQQAITESNFSASAETCVECLYRERDTLKSPPLISDLLDQHRNLSHQPAWCDTITHQISQCCAAYFDQDQADWHPQMHASGSHSSLYCAWRETLKNDHSIAFLMEHNQVAIKSASLHTDPVAQIKASLQQLQIDAEWMVTYLTAILFRIHGWASWCAYQNWEARLQGQENTYLVELLAIRLSWESLLDDGERCENSLFNAWQNAWSEHFNDSFNCSTEQMAGRIWQRAHEISYQEQLLSRLSESATPAKMESIDIQAVFCIDVRSEVFRRHFEAQSDRIQTLGFAGFFGLPISFTPIGTTASRPQLPGLLASSMQVSECSHHHDKHQSIVAKRETKLNQILSWKPFQSLPTSSFTLVETLGLSYAAHLLKRTLPNRDNPEPHHYLGLDHQDSQHLSMCLSQGNQPLSAAEKATLGVQILSGMNLTKHLAPLVLLVGHGSQTQNNPQQAGLDCGACCGQTGEVNSRALATLLNDQAVRMLMREQGVDIPETTLFIAALHNTTTDEVTLFDAQNSGPNLDLEAVKKHLDLAGMQARQERASQLGLENLKLTSNQLKNTLRQKSNDWSETRPEWGLANNAAFIIGPRRRTRGINLNGRTFLHEYERDTDPEGELLEQIMTAPMIVTHWINMQYFASTVDNDRFGSGNKTLHNVVGGRIGVFEGNGGDLRIGLAKQSLHNGHHWMHEPLRLTVVIDAPKAKILKIINKHPSVKHLIANRWLYIAYYSENNRENTIEFIRLTPEPT